MHPDFCFVLEDDSGICGYAVCVPDVKEFQLRLESEWLVKMREKYPDPCPNKQEDLTATEVRMYTDIQIARLKNLHPKYQQIDTQKIFLCLSLRPTTRTC